MSPSADLLAVRKALTFLFGRWTWEAPPWLSRATLQVARGRRSLAAHPARAGLLALALIVAAGGSFWYATPPQPPHVPSPRTAPPLTGYNAQRHHPHQPPGITFP